MATPWLRPERPESGEPVRGYGQRHRLHDAAVADDVEKVLVHPQHHTASRQRAGQLHVAVAESTEKVAAESARLLCPAAPFTRLSERRKVYWLGAAGNWHDARHLAYRLLARWEGDTSVSALDLALARADALYADSQVIGWTSAVHHLRREIPLLAESLGSQHPSSCGCAPASSKDSPDAAPSRRRPHRLRFCTRTPSERSVPITSACCVPDRPSSPPWGKRATAPNRSTWLGRTPWTPTASSGSSTRSP
ncbi:hypothetical protein SCOCK_580024 [Actinacidiphila cocklensis]|uniref:Uncharacterized protein n=1 Tax=Actinacidiphila cocklensis TaxID=887465 RepID=A0A9W4DXA9_9ACTN|nr:hypothetical protein SCOCK_580024 [Actinacidiphila cocklensis]